MADFATLQDVQDLWKALNESEQAQVTKLLPLVSNRLRYEAAKVNKDLDEMVADNEDIASVAKTVTVDIVKRYVNDNSVDGASLSQFSQSAGGYTVSGTYLVPGGGIFIKKAELSALGLRRQRYGVIDFYGDCN